MAFKAGYVGIKKLSEQLNLTTEGTLSLNVENDPDAGGSLPISGDAAKILAERDAATRQLIDDTVGWISKNLISIEQGKWDYQTGNKVSADNRVRSTDVLELNGEYEINISTTAEKTIQFAFNRWASVPITGQTAIEDSGWKNSGKYKLKGYYTFNARYSDANDINPSDVTFTLSHVSVEESKVNTSVIAPVEDGTTFSQAYTIGQHFTRNGAFCTLTANVAQNDTILDNTPAQFTAGDVASSLIYTKEKQVTMDTLSFTDTGNSSKYALLDFNSDLPQGAKILTAIICDPWQGRAEPFPSIAVNSANRGIHLVVPREVTYGEYYLTFRVLYTF